jgi:hypothetical protein
MKPYKVLAEVTTRYTVEVHGEDEGAVYDTVELMGPQDVMDAGEFESTVDVACVSMELLHPEDYDEPDEMVELSPEDQADLAAAEESLAEPGEADLDDLEEFESEEETDGQEDAHVSD